MNIVLSRRSARFGLLSVLMSFAVVPEAVAQLSSPVEPFTIARAQQLAVERDHGVTQLRFNAQAMLSDGESKGQLPDPVLILGAQNMPTDSFRLDQEPMTQLRIGVRQMFPQGDSLDLAREKGDQQSRGMLHQASDRLLQLQRQVRKLWLETFYWQHNQQLLEEDRAFFTQLLTVTQSLYSVGKVRQQDVLRAELELNRLDDRLIRARESEQAQRAMLSRWTGPQSRTTALPGSLPELAVPALKSVDASLTQAMDRETLADLLGQHPAIARLRSQIDVSETEIGLAETQYDPRWGVELSYGYRDGENMDGSNRTDLVSAVVTVSMPLFSSTAQDSQLRSRKLQREALRAALLDQLTDMTGQVETLLARYEQINSQLALYRGTILDKSAEHANSALNAYQSDAAGFNDVMRAYLAQQKDRLDALRLEVDRQVLLSELQYFFPETLPELAGLPGDFQ